MTNKEPGSGENELHQDVAENLLLTRKNRLAGETSPYLLQHAGNPVHWRPWDDEALEEARRENKPIFLSIGYSACHWCHVMEQESFENEDIAALLNTHFICIKVDREERPDLDEIYMQAVMALTGRGGWPMSVFLTPELKPFYGGTYFPPFGRGGYIGFFQLLTRIAEIWRTTPSEILESADEITRHLRSGLVSAVTGDVCLTPALRENAVGHLESVYDELRGGWGSAPKFPSAASISLLLLEYQRKGRPRLLEMAEHTLQRMALGGIYDHLGGGFHRYSVDENWLVPHFEKMLYDNAQLACVYLEAWQVSGKEFYQRITIETLQYLLREMRGNHGAFFSSEDADSGGEEGQYYLWTRREILDRLGQEDGSVFCQAYNIREEGNFASPESAHRGKNILHQSDLSNEAKDLLSSLKNRLLEQRNSRPRPGKDDKIITAWNALAISAFSKAAFAWDIAEFKDAACQAGLFLKNELLRDGVLHRTWRLGKARFPGYLDDYAFTTNAFVDLYECTADASWLAAARALGESMLERFHDVENGGFYSSAHSHTHLLARVKPLHDTSEPSPNAAAALALARLGCFFEHPGFTECAGKALMASAALAARAPLGYLSSIIAADYLLEPNVEVVFVGPRDREDMRALVKVLADTLVPCRVVVWSPGTEETAVPPLCASKPMLGTSATVYVCANNTCLPPADTPEAFASLLKRMNLP